MSTTATTRNYIRRKNSEKATTPIGRFLFGSPYRTIIIALVVAQVLVWTMGFFPRPGIYFILMALFVALLIFNFEYYVLSIFLIIPWAWRSMAIQVGPVSLKATYVLITVGFLYFFIKQILSKRTPWAGTPLDLPLIVFVGISLLSVGISIDPKWSIREAVQIGVYVTYYFLLTNVLRTRESVVRAANMVILATVSVALVGMSGITGHATTHTGGFQRMLAGFGDPNLSANYLLMGLPVAFVLSLDKSKKLSEKWLYILATGILGTGMLLTYSRAGWVVSILVLLLVSFLVRTALKGMSVLMVAVLMLGLLGAPSLQQRAVQATSLDESSNLSHFYLWKSAWTIITGHPVLGIGAGAFPRYFKKYVGTSVLPPMNVFGKPVYFSHLGENGFLAHNAFLQMWAELGTLGFLTFIFIIIRFVRIMVSQIKNMEDDPFKLVLIGLFGAVVGIALDNLSITNLIDHFWGTLAIAMAGAQAVKSRGRVEDERLNA